MSADGGRGARGGDRRSGSSRPEERGVYIISVAAELAGVHPQTLRVYERRGLLNPSRTAGNTRRYSQADIERLRLIQELTQGGVSLAGVKMIVEMEAQLAELRAQAEELRTELERVRRRMREEVEHLRRRAAPAEIVPLRSLRRFPWEAGGR